MTSYASSRDAQPIEEVNYYGALTNIIELNYSGKYKIVLFRCDWVDLNRGCKKDKFGLTLVNFSHLAHSGTNLVHDPFIFASQAKKVYYVKDEKDAGWLLVKHAKLRDVFDMGDESAFNRDGRSVEMLNAESDEENAPAWVRHEAGNGVDITREMENEHILVEDPTDDNIDEDFF